MEAGPHTWCDSLPLALNATGSAISNHDDWFTRSGQESMDAPVSELLSDFSLRPDDLFVASYPRSGTTWMQQIVKLVRTNGLETGERINLVIPNLSLKKIEVCKNLVSPRAIKSHLHYHMMPSGDPATSCAKYIYVARNPKDVVVSLFYHTRRRKGAWITGDWDCFFEQFVSGRTKYDSWFDHVLGWWKHKDADNILFIKYEDMKEDTRRAVETVSRFMGYDLVPAVVDSICEQTSFEAMKNNDTVNKSWKRVVTEGCGDFIRKGIVGDWRNHFTEHQSDRLDKIYFDRITGTGLVFRF